MKAILTLIASFGAAFATFILQVILSRNLEPQDFGLLALANSITIIIGTFSSSGISSLLLRRASISPAESYELVKTAIASTLFISSISYLTCSLTLIFYGIPLTYSVILSTAIFALSAQSILTTLGQIKNSAKTIAISQTTLPSMRATLASALLFSPAGVAVAAALIGAANLASMALYIFSIRKMPISNESVKRAPSGMLEYIKSSLKYSVNGSINMAQIQLSTTLIGSIHGVQAAGHMAICNTLTAALYIAPNTIFGTYLQKRFHTLSNAEKKKPITLSLVSFFAGLLASALIYMASDPIVTLLFGAQYQQAIDLLRAVCPAIPVRFFITGIGAAILSEELVKKKISASAFGLFAQAALIVSLYKYGAYGIGASILIGELLTASLYIKIYRKTFAK
ncbi:teichoic acid transporter [Pseudomonas taiwanensis]|uniref:oligosaccharide flippase family protein n=1 Tax=Pseudomonas taiwanensis TaxID=470150 RepID=UPI0015BFF368|nr:oligosaccharide flippase family protein [Pseudomonas taiwanensis]NWL79050.1 teichoic acid transporter [Pseudomonas taiwanensis]